MLIQNGNEVFRELSIREIFGCDVIVRPDILGGGRGGEGREGNQVSGRRGRSMLHLIIIIIIIIFNTYIALFL